MALVKPTGVASDDRLPGGGRLVATRQAEALALRLLPHQVDEGRTDGRLDAAHSSPDDDGLDVRQSNGRARLTDGAEYCALVARRHSRAAECEGREDTKRGCEMSEVRSVGSTDHVPHIPGGIPLE
jgi:hypothetical protein